MRDTQGQGGTEDWRGGGKMRNRLNTKKTSMNRLHCVKKLTKNSSILQAIPGVELSTPFHLPPLPRRYHRRQ